MKTVQTLIMKALVVVLLAIGALSFWKAPGALYIWIRSLPFFPAEELRPWVQYGGAFLMLITGVFVLFPFGKRWRKGNQIIFEQGDGKTTVQLSPIETTLTKAVGKLPQIKKASVSVLPDGEGRNVRVYAEVVLIKTASSGVREASDRAKSAVRQEAVRVLGVDEVTEVELDVRDIVISDAANVAALEREPAGDHASLPEPEPEPYVEPEPEPEPEPLPEPEEDTDEPGPMFEPETPDDSASGEDVSEDDDEDTLPGSALDSDEEDSEEKDDTDKWELT